MTTKHNPERRTWRGRSYKVGGRNRFVRVRTLREKQIKDV